MMDKQTDLLVLGGGASGLMCAGIAAQQGKSVIVLDYQRKMGQKIINAGGGRCNFTNSILDHTHYYGNNPDFTRSALSRFDSDKILSFFRERGVRFHLEKNGQIFTDAGGSWLLNCLLAFCREGRVRTYVGAQIRGVKHDGKQYQVESTAGIFSSPRLVVATGGLSYPRMGASHMAFQLARQFGHEVVPTRPGLVPLEFSSGGWQFSTLSGVSFHAEVTCEGKKFSGPVLITHRGLSGPAILDASCVWQPGCELTLNLDPDEKFLAQLLFAAQSGEKKELRVVLSNHLPRRFAEIWASGPQGRKPVSGLSHEEITRFCDSLCDWRLSPDTTSGYSKAEVTLGGIDTREVSSKTFESQKQPGLYFIGEALDVTGKLGGYNLHWAWASGMAAGLA